MRFPVSRSNTVPLRCQAWPNRQLREDPTLRARACPRAEVFLETDASKNHAATTPATRSLDEA